MQTQPEYDTQNNDIHYNGYHIEFNENEKFVIQVNLSSVSFPEFDNLLEACQFIDLLNYTSGTIH